MALMDLQTLAGNASPAAVDLARSILEHDIGDRAWSRQVGPALTQRDTARLLGKSEQAVAKDRRLLRLRSGDGRPVYPVLQFSGRAQVPGVSDVVATLAGVLEPATVASWLTASNHDLDGRRPIDALAGGDTDRVLVLAGRLARSAA